MSAQRPSDLNAELLDDFFAEADEHLLGIRQALLQTEELPSLTQPDGSIVEGLFRNFHSFKGISAIVGLTSAEAVAHATEDFLRLLRSGKSVWTEKGVEVLNAATRKLEQIVAAFREQKPLPGYESLLSDLRRQCEGASSDGSGGAGTLAMDLQITSEEAKARGLLLCKFTFSPSHEINAKGININTIRDDLGQIGEIVKSVPRVRGPGMIAFEFLVATREPPGDIAAWEAKGVTVELAEHEQPASSAASSVHTAPLEEAAHSPFLAPSHVVRIDLKRLDDLMRITGEMVIQRSRLETQLAQLKGNARQLDLRGAQEVSSGLGRTLRELREAIMRVRLVPVSEIFGRMPFVVRDLMRQTQKKVRVKLEGQDTAVDKYLIERLKDPLLHLVRNAFSHGVETPAERSASQKPEEGTIELVASTAGDSVVIQVRDDGRGINPNAIIERARKMGLDVPETVDKAAILGILCSSGFSTRDDADRTSGRGVGMAVVQGAVRELGGNLTLESEEGRGTQFTLRLPLTLLIVETLIVQAAGQTCAIPQSFVTQILHMTEAEIQTVNGIEVIPYRSGVLPIIRLAGLFRLKNAAKPNKCLLVLTSERGSVGILTESILGQREVVVRALRDPLIQLAGIAGATELGDGKPVLILDAAALTGGNVRPAERLDSSVERV